MCDPPLLARVRGMHSLSSSIKNLIEFPRLKFFRFFPLNNSTMRNKFQCDIILMPDYYYILPPPPTVENRIYWRTSRSNWIACSVDRWSTISCEGWCIFTRPRWRAMEIWNRPTAWSIHASSSRSPTLDCTSWGGLLIAGRKSTRTITRFGGVSESFVLVQSNSFVGRREGGIIGGINREGKVGKAGGWRESDSSKEPGQNDWPRVHVLRLIMPVNHTFASFSFPLCTLAGYLAVYIYIYFKQTCTLSCEHRAYAWI